MLLCRVFMLSVVMLSVIMLSVVMLSVVVPFQTTKNHSPQKSFYENDSRDQSHNIFWHKFTDSFFKAISFHSKAINIVYVYKMV
jgi:hypothetical protein